MECKKEELVESIIIKWKNYLRRLIRNRKDNNALKVITALATFLYEWNQSFVDNELESYLDLIAQRNLSPSFNKSQCDKKTIIYYDSFGFDNRGLTIIYLKAICDSGYRVVYISPEGQSQPVLENATKNYNILWRFVSTKNTLEKAHIIDNIFNEFKPFCAFLYALPSDSAAIATFNAYKDVVTRFQIDLTDHAFWLGLNAFDYCIEFRNFGATVSARYRKISKSKLLLLPYYPFIDKTIPFAGFGPKFEGKKVIFSGGSIKKTLGDKNLLFYKMVYRLLKENEDAAFLYAGSGPDTREMDKLISQFSNRAERISERKDLYQVLKHSVFFLNTYPDNGGLMTQYSAVAGKLPISFYDGQRDLTGLISNRDKLNIEFTDLDKLCDEVNHILSNEAYRRKKESFLEDSVISENLFNYNIKCIIESHKSTFELSTEEPVELRETREEYVRCFNIREQLYQAISNYKIMGRVFPYEFLILCIRKLFRLGK